MPESGKDSIWFIHPGDTSTIGGAETCLREWSQELIDEGYSVEWWHFPRDKKPNQVNSAPRGVNIRDLTTYKLPLLRRFCDTSSGKLVTQSAKQEQPRKIVFNGYTERNFSLIDGLRGEGMLDRVTQIYHGDPEPPRKIAFGDAKEIIKRTLIPVRTEIARRLYLGSQANHLAVSAFVADRVTELGLADTIDIVHPPITDQQNCNPKKPSIYNDRLQIVTVSRISPEKGMEFLKEIACAARGLDLPVDFTLVGSAPSELQMVKYRAMFGDMVTLVGPRTGLELCDSYRAADLFVMPSPNEGLGMVTIESMQHGLPVLATSIPPTREIFSMVPESPGFLVDKSSPKGVVEAVEVLKAISNNRSLLAELSAHAVQMRQTYDSNKLRQQFVDAVLRN